MSDTLTFVLRDPHEAADEIERLRAEIERLNGIISQLEIDDRARAAAAMAEIERLRKRCVTYRRITAAQGDEIERLREENAQLRPPAALKEDKT